ncbi:ATP-dependent DNA helicase Q1-like [Diadema antillarum]|uniref:ATP-dependent DNA helicase Q1-like n=1 Tax=Diadema antillarum TaxID=105358 RepID=UPI003A88996F
MAGRAEVMQGLEEVTQELEHVERQIQRLLEKQQRLLERKAQLERQANRLQELGSQEGATGWDKSDFPWSPKLLSVRESVFGIREFRPLQEETMNASLSGRDVILLMPTGGGKSLCYQLPALVSKGFTLVVSPLVSLMEDQTMALEDLGVSATVLSSNTTPESVKEIHRQMIDGRSGLKLLYVTPEKIAKSKRFMACLEKAYKAKFLARIAIDEVHCCSQWGHDFRPDYKILGLLKRQFPEAPILGLTATATIDVLEDVKSILGLQGCQIFRAGFNRPNLFYEVRPKPSKQAECMEELVKLVDGEFKGQSGIIYCFSRKDAESVAEGLKQRGIRAHPYHAMLDAQYKSSVHRQWKQNKIQVVVATVAFGMGIDKPDVRFVIHHSISKSMENYYQESGRAGRDDRPAKCIVFYGLADVFRQSTMVVTEQTGQEKLYNMIAYCVSPAMCRRRLIGRHFGERWKNASQCNNMCDVCRSGVQAAEKDITLHVQRICKILDQRAREETRITALKLLDELMSKKGVAPLDKDVAKTMKISDYEHIIAHLLLEGYLKEDFHFTPYNTISYVVPGSKARLVSSNPPRTVTISIKGDRSQASKVKGQVEIDRGKVREVPQTERAGSSGTRAEKVGDREREERKPGKSEEGASRKQSHASHCGKAKKRKLDEPVVIDLCSDEGSDDDSDFVASKPSKQGQPSTKTSFTSQKHERSGVVDADSSAAGKTIGGTDVRKKSSMGKDSKQVQTLSNPRKGETSTDSAIQTKHSERAEVNVKDFKVREPAPLASRLSEGFQVSCQTSSQSLAKPTPKIIDAIPKSISKQVQSPSKPSTHDFSQPSSRDESKTPKTCKVTNESVTPSSSISPVFESPPSRRKASFTPPCATSPGSDYDLDLRTVYTEQLMSLGSDGESFNRENSSFTMSTSFSGSEDGMSSGRRDTESGALSGRKRKGAMRRVDSMDEDMASAQDEYEVLERVYMKQMEHLNESL